MRTFPSPQVTYSCILYHLGFGYSWRVTCKKHNFDLLVVFQETSKKGKVLWLWKVFSWERTSSKFGLPRCHLPARSKLVQGQRSTALSQTLMFTRGNARVFLLVKINYLRKILQTLFWRRNLHHLCLIPLHFFILHTAVNNEWNFSGCLYLFCLDLD